MMILRVGKEEVYIYILILIEIFYLIFILSFSLILPIKTLDEITDGGGKKEEFVLDEEWIFEKEFTYFQPTIEVIKITFTISLLLH